jgi:hypothetical protein
MESGKVMNVLVPQGDAEATAEADHLKFLPRKSVANTKAPVP